MLKAAKAAPKSAPAPAPAPSGKTRYNELRPSPAGAEFKLCVVEFNVPGAKNGGSDKGPNGHRIDSIPIANSVIEAGGACEIIKYSHDKHDEFAAKTADVDALIVRINPGQLSQGTTAGTQKRFDALMNDYISKGKLVWSSQKVQTQMGAKDALVKIGKMKCGLPDTLAYYTKEELEKGFKETCAYQPRVIKQNRGSAGEGIWLCWLCDADKKVKANIDYPAKTFGEKSLEDGDMLKLMEMNDNHVEYHTVKEFLTFCVDGPDGEGAGTWTSTFPGKYLEGGKEAGGQLVDQRLLPRIDEGEVRILMAGDTCQMAIHKKPLGGRRQLRVHVLPADRRQVQGPRAEAVRRHPRAPAVARPQGRAAAPPVDVRLHPEEPRRLGEGPVRPLVPRRQDRVHRRRVQLLVRRHLQVPGRVRRREDARRRARRGLLGRVGADQAHGREGHRDAPEGQAVRRRRSGRVACEDAHGGS